MKLLLYCVKAKPYLRDYRGKAIFNRFVISPSDRPFTSDDTQPILNGKIVGECDFEVEEIYERVSLNDSWFNDLHHTKTMKNDELLKKSCLKVEEMNKYFDYPKNTLDKVGYAIHIKNLHIFDKPRELSEYLNNKYWNSHFGNDRVNKAPQNMMRVYKLKDIEWEEYILISIRPEHLVNILNGEKTIEIRKKVLKEMIK